MSFFRKLIKYIIFIPPSGGMNCFLIGDVDDRAEYNVLV